MYMDTQDLSRLGRADDTMRPHFLPALCEAVSVDFSTSAAYEQGPCNRCFHAGTLALKAAEAIATGSWID